MPPSGTTTVTVLPSTSACKVVPSGRVAGAITLTRLIAVDMVAVVGRIVNRMRFKNSNSYCLSVESVLCVFGISGMIHWAEPFDNTRSIIDGVLFGLFYACVNDGTTCTYPVSKDRSVVIASSLSRS